MAKHTRQWARTLGALAIVLGAVAALAGIPAVAGATSVTPQVTSINSEISSPAGGNTIAIYGTGFTRTSVVKIGGVVTPNHYVSATYVTVIAPPGTAGTSKAVHVSNGTNVSTTVKADELWYVASEPKAFSNPSSNLAPKYTTVTSCTTGTTYYTYSCTQLWLANINYARSLTDVAPMELPSNWFQLSVPKQLITIINLERSARGLAPAVALSTIGNQDATRAAQETLVDGPAGVRQHLTDPKVTSTQFPDNDLEWSRGIAGGGNVLHMDYSMMYSDGWGGSRTTTYNLDCTSADSTACWSHRQDILCYLSGLHPDETVFVGAAYDTDTLTADIFEMPNTPPIATDYTYSFTADTTVPDVTTLSSSSGTTNGGQTITVIGSGFFPETTVTFGTTSLSYTQFKLLNPGKLQVTVPAGSVGSVYITVTTPGGRSATSASNRYTYTAPPPPPPVPTITSLSPNSGASSTHTAVTVHGTGFLAGATLYYGGSNTVCTDSGDTIAPCTVENTSTIGVTLPPSSTSQVIIWVRTAGGSSNTESFTYTSKAPTSTPPTTTTGGSPPPTSTGGSGGSSPSPTPTPTTPTPVAYPGSLSGTVVGIAPLPNGRGYWLAGAAGGVSAHGDAQLYGSMAGQTLNAPITHIVATPDGKGYWLVAEDGGTFAFGDAGFYGSMGGQHLDAPVVDIAPTQDGKGYWLVASDGGIFAFGDAGFYGSMGGQPLNKPVVGLEPDYATGGYWEVASDGGIFAFGAPFYGSTGGISLNKPVNGMTATVGDEGYWFVASDGGIFAFGNAAFYGSPGASPPASPVVGMATDSATGGYWLVTQAGQVLAYNAPQLGTS